MIAKALVLLVVCSAVLSAQPTHKRLKVIRLSTDARTRYEKSAEQSLQDLHKDLQPCHTDDQSDSWLVDYRACLYQHLKDADRDYLTYESSVRMLYLDASEMEKVEIEIFLPEMTRTFDQAADAWRSYRKTECRAEAAVFEGGTAAVEAEPYCNLLLIKQRASAMCTSFMGKSADDPECDFSKAVGE